MRTKKGKPRSVIILAAVVSFMFIAMASNSLAQITISGTVTDSDGYTLEGIAVGLYTDCYGGAPVNGAYTNSEGYYTITHSPGTYYVGATDNLTKPYCGTNYVSEYWNEGDIEPHTCENATQVSTTRTVNFSLLNGISITGNVAPAAGGAGIENVDINFYAGSACDGEYITSVQTDSNGDYCFTVPQDSGAFYVFANTSFLPPEVDLAPEWYTSAGGTFYCQEADGISSDADKAGINFDLENGGTISGTVMDYNGNPVAGVTVTIWNDALDQGWQQETTDESGDFVLENLAPGPWEVRILPDVTSGLVHSNQDYWLNLSQDRNIGEIRLRPGALVTGYLKDVGETPLLELEYWYGGKFEIGWDWSNMVDGSFQFRLPLGSYTLNLDPEDSGYTMLPVDIDVTDVEATIDLDTLTAYDDTTGDHIQGTVTDSADHTGQFLVMAFGNSQLFTPDKFGGVDYLGVGEPEFPGGGSYSMFLPPDRTVMAVLVLFHEDIKGLEYLTVVSTPITGIDMAMSGPTLTGQDFVYSDAGHTVEGYVKSSSAPYPPYRATVVLYKQPGDHFAGFADSDDIGYYRFYNVPGGDYKIAVTHPRYRDEVAWSAQFTVSDDTMVPDIFMGEEGEKHFGDFNGDGKADILWRDSATGRVSIWFIDGITKIGGGSPGKKDLNWVIEGVGDFDGDTSADMLWRDMTSGEVIIWLIDGFTRIGGGSLGKPGLNWTIEGLGDSSGDTNADILWRDSATGRVSIWFIDGVSKIGGGSPGKAALNWEIQ